MHDSPGMRVLITGANGFVGHALCVKLASQRYAVRAALRAASRSTPMDAESVLVGNINLSTDWRLALDGVDTVVHLAARVHVMRDRTQDPLAAYREVNTAGTLRLAEAAVTAGVRRFVYVSTIKVNGVCSSGTPFKADDVPQPGDAYAQSKWETELGLRDISRLTGLELVIVRPPLVYGPGVKGNFLSLLHVMRRGIPLPLGSCVNRRSLLGLSNLVDLLEKCVIHPAAAGQVFLAADGEDMSTPELLCRVASALDRKARLLWVPPPILRSAARFLGRPGIYERLCGSLQVNTGKTCELLGWTPPLTVDEELVRTARWFMASNP